MRPRVPLRSAVPCLGGLARSGRERDPVLLVDPLCQPRGVGVASVGLPSSAARSALRAACGDGGAEPSLGGGEVGPVDRRVSGRGGDEALPRGVAVGVVGVVVLPEAPDDLAPRATEDARGVLVTGASRAGAVIDVGRPGVVTAA